ncbi:sterol-binding protein [Pelagibius litoralis]|uniref:Sterol-binding protein n=1 Tax=Pelagibius litoralis TaxID=374515 RepID=A0A967CC77_9PROT|nr:SCP2 sterol-binding domain-containing protein [Pelagibius litoralis]NIA68804.1 sterol-binding protein [Pelagibius litoralis]
MSLESLTEQLKAQAALNAPLGYRVLFDMGDDGAILWDGTATPAEIAPVENGAAEADTTLRFSLDDLGKLLEGNLDPTLAYMTGKLKIEGSMGVAMKLAALLGD